VKAFWGGVYEMTNKLSKVFEARLAAVTGAAFYAVKVRPVTI
jgi:hypothetical protein